MTDALVSTAPLRAGNINRRSLEAVKGKLAMEFNRMADQDFDPQKQAVRFWNKYIPFSPQTAVEILTGDLPKSTRVYLYDVYPHGQGDLKIGKPYAAELGRCFGDHRSFDLSEGTVESGFMMIGTQLRGRGIGRIMMRNQIEFFHACGARDFKIMAGSNNGGYTWARMGFLPTGSESPYFNKEIIIPFKQKMKALKPFLPRALYREVMGSISFDDPHAIWQIADQRVDIMPHLKPLYDSKGHIRNGLKKKQDRLTTIARDVFNEASQGGTGLPLGRLLLTGSTWNGVLKMDDPVQMARVGRYVGGWRYIAPA